MISCFFFTDVMVRNVLNQVVVVLVSLLSATGKRCRTEQSNEKEEEQTERCKRQYGDVVILVFAITVRFLIAATVNVRL